VYVLMGSGEFERVWTVILVVVYRREKPLDVLMKG